jgi:hypothetical protein
MVNMIAMYTFVRGHAHRGTEEVIDEGDAFEVTGTAQASAQEEARFMVARHTARFPTEDESREIYGSKGVVNFGPQSYGKLSQPAGKQKGGR